MPDAVLLEAVHDDSSSTSITMVGPDEGPGSVSSDDWADDPDANPARRLYLFGWYEGECGVWESQAGMDAEDPEVRVLYSVAFVKLSDLTVPYSLTIHRPGRPPGTVRLSRVTVP